MVKGCRGSTGAESTDVEGQQMQRVQGVMGAEGQVVQGV